MSSIRTVNLIWETKTRASYPVSRYAVNDEGAVTLAMPRPLEVRAYDLTLISKDESKQTSSGFSVETLLELEASSGSQNAIGMTSDDLYLLVNGTKKRFLSERHNLYTDSSLSRDGKLIVAGFSDMSGSSFAFAYGDISGEAHWLHELPDSISCLALSPDGVRVAIGSETGRLWMMDSARRNVWGFEQNESVRSIAIANGGKFTAYGTVGGKVGLIDDEGSRRWEVDLPGSVACIALSENGGICAVLCESESGNALLYCLVGKGQIGWEFDADRKFASLALSPNGQFLAVSGKDGVHIFYEIMSAETQNASDAHSSVIKSSTAGSYEATPAPSGKAGELIRLRADLHTSQTEVASCERYLKLQESIVREAMDEAQSRETQSDLIGAVSTLVNLCRAAPESYEAVSALREARHNHGLKYLNDAKRCLQESDLNAAESALSKGLECDPFSVDLRREFAGLNSQRAKHFDLEADKLIGAGKIEEAYAILEKAQAIEPERPRTDKMTWARTILEFNSGMTAYNEKRYREAVFQFKKALARDPNHSEAKRYLAFAQRFDNDANEALNDRFSKLEGLE